MSEEQRPREQQQQQQQADEVEAHGKSAENVEQGDEAAGDDDVDAHRSIRTASPKNA